MPDTIVIAFTDIVDSTAAKRTIGDAAYMDVADRHNALIRSIVGDAELKTIGDSFMLRFHDPAEAVAKLVEIQRRLDKSPITLASAPLAIRVGIHIGNPIASPSVKGDEDYLGTIVDQGARYESLARGGQIIISAELHALVKDRMHDLPGITFHDWGPYFLKGVGWRKVFEVLWEGRPPLAPSGKPQYQSRRFLTPFVGREAELGKIESYLADPKYPLVTLKGPGGIGKTRLADEIEHRAAQLFPDGTFFAELESTQNSPAAIEEQIRARCGIASGATEDFLAPKSALLILNNCESVPDVRKIASKLLKHCGGLRVLATSQVPLKIYGEQIWPVESLEPADAEKLFVESARRNHPGFTVAPADREYLEKIFEYTDRIPFCLELSAAKVRPGRSLHGISSGIAAKISDLVGPMESARHSSVTACLDWSFGLLTEAEKLLFPKLSVFRGGFLPKDVAAICAAPDAEPLLYSLFDASFLRLIADRFFLLPTATEYATAKLGEETMDIKRRHSEHFLELAKEADRKTKTKDHREGFSTFRAEFENMRAGMLWAVETQVDDRILSFGYAFAGNLAPLLRAAAAVEFSEWALQAAKRTGNLKREAEASINLGNAYRDLPTGDRTQNVLRAIQCFEAALRVFTEPDFPKDWATTQNNLGIAHGDLPAGDRAQNLQRAIQYYEAALRVYTEHDFPKDWAMTQNNLGIVYRSLPIGDRAQNLQRAIQYYEAALRVYTEHDFPTAWAATQNNLGVAYRNLPTGDRAQNLQRAIQCYEVALRVYTEHDFPTDWAMTQNNLGAAYSSLSTGDRAQNIQSAIQCYEAALRVYTERDFPTDWAKAQNNLGAAYGELPTGDRAQNLQRAIQCFEATLRVRTERDFPTAWAATQNNLGNAYNKLPTGDRTHNLQRAIQYYEAALLIYTERDFPTDWAMTQNNLGIAYDELPTGDRRQYLERAIQSFENAIRGYRTANLREKANDIVELVARLKSGDNHGKERKKNSR